MGDIDEVWFWEMPGATALEWYVKSTADLCGADKSSSRYFGMHAFSYERGYSEMLEDLGHRMEYTLTNFKNVKWTLLCRWIFDSG